MVLLRSILDGLRRFSKCMVSAFLVVSETKLAFHGNFGLRENVGNR